MGNLWYDTLKLRKEKGGRCHGSRSKAAENFKKTAEPGRQGAGCLSRPGADRPGRAAGACMARAARGGADDHPGQPLERQRGRRLSAPADHGAGRPGGRGLRPGAAEYAGRLRL